jgi:hypothetical protein
LFVLISKNKCALPNGILCTLDENREREIEKEERRGIKRVEE